MIKADENSPVIKSFNPVVDKNSRILILGTMPGEESLRQQQYYAHPRNLFWPLLYAIFDKPPEREYEKRLQFLREHGIALWDVFKSCERKGSLDSSIQKEEHNDIAGLLASYPAIRHVFCNGETACRQFSLKVLPYLNRTVFYKRLPSTSPANASVTYQAKLDQWSQIRFTLENRIWYETLLNTELGEITILSDDTEVIRICLPGGDKPDLKQIAVFPENEPGRIAAEQIMEYLNGKRKTFSVPFHITGTPFARKVYQALLDIPYGRTISYGELAARAGNARAARAVGQIVRKNLLPLLIPCHRVIGSGGRNIGFMGIPNNPMQNRLLQLERNNIAEENDL